MEMREQSSGHVQKINILECSLLLDATSGISTKFCVDSDIPRPEICKFGEFWRFGEISLNFTKFRYCFWKICTGTSLSTQRQRQQRQRQRQGQRQRQMIM